MLVFGLKIFILVKKFEGSQKKREKRNSCIKMSFKELLALRGKKLAGKFSAPKTGGLEKEDEGERHHELDKLIDIIINIVINILIKSTFLRLCR